MCVLGGKALKDLCCKFSHGEMASVLMSTHLLLLSNKSSGQTDINFAPTKTFANFFSVRKRGTGDDVGLNPYVPACIRLKLKHRKKCPKFPSVFIFHLYSSLKSPCNYLRLNASLGDRRQTRLSIEWDEVEKKIERSVTD